MVAMIAFIFAGFYLVCEFIYHFMNYVIKPYRINEIGTVQLVNYVLWETGVCQGHSINAIVLHRLQRIPDLLNSWLDVIVLGFL